LWAPCGVWDARLPAALILSALSLGPPALPAAFDAPARGARAAAILCLVGSVNLPIIKFSVEWWNTLHQPASILRPGGPAIDSSMLWPLLVMFLAFLCYFAAVHILRTRAELTLRKIRNLRLSADPAE
jgi:heme exporter protein C